MNCCCNYGYKKSCFLPQESNSKYWQVIEAPTVCTNGRFHKSYTSNFHILPVSYLWKPPFVQMVGASKTAQYLWQFDSMTASETLAIGNRTSVISAIVSVICNYCIHNCIAAYIGDNCSWLVSCLSGRTLACRSWVLGFKLHLRHWNSEFFFNFRQITANSYL